MYELVCTNPNMAWYTYTLASVLSSTSSYSSTLLLYVLAISMHIMHRVCILCILCIRTSVCIHHVRARRLINVVCINIMQSMAHTSSYSMPRRNSGCFWHCFPPPHAGRGEGSARVWRWYVLASTYAYLEAGRTLAFPCQRANGATGLDRNLVRGLSSLNTC